MSKLQPSMLTDEVCSVTTDKKTNKKTYWVKTEVTFFTLIFLFLFLWYIWNKKGSFQKDWDCNSPKYTMRMTIATRHSTETRIWMYLVFDNCQQVLVTVSQWESKTLIRTTITALAVGRGREKGWSEIRGRERERSRERERENQRKKNKDRKTKKTRQSLPSFFSRS